MKKQKKVQVVPKMDYDRGKIVKRIHLSPKTENKSTMTDNVSWKSKHAKHKKAKGNKIK